MLYPLSYGRVEKGKALVYRRLAAVSVVFVVNDRVLNRGLDYNRITTRARFVDPAHAPTKPATMHVQVRAVLFEAAVSEHFLHAVKRPPDLEQSARAFGSQIMKV